MEDITPVNLSELIQVNHMHDGTIIPTKNGSLNLMHWNIDRLTEKLHEVECRILDYPSILHIVAISETWLTPYNYPTYQLAGY